MPVCVCQRACRWLLDIYSWSHPHGLHEPAPPIGSRWFIQHFVGIHVKSARLLAVPPEEYW